NLNELRKPRVPRPRRGERDRQIQLDDMHPELLRHRHRSIRRSRIDVHHVWRCAQRRFQAHAEPFAFVSTDRNHTDHPTMLLSRTRAGIPTASAPAGTSWTTTE